MTFESILLYICQYIRFILRVRFSWCIYMLLLLLFYCYVWKYTENLDNISSCLPWIFHHLEEISQAATLLIVAKTDCFAYKQINKHFECHIFMQHIIVWQSMRMNQNIDLLRITQNEIWMNIIAIGISSRTAIETRTLHHKPFEMFFLL